MKRGDGCRVVGSSGCGERQIETFEGRSITSDLRSGQSSGFCILDTIFELISYDGVWIAIGLFRKGGTNLEKCGFWAGRGGRFNPSRLDP